MIKKLIRELLIFLHLDLSKNLEYDRLTNLILKKHLKSNSNCLDVGCHKGEILDLMLALSPNGRHIGFEPLPDFFDNLKTKYENIATILPYALSDQSGITQFQYVKNDPAYSGIKKRKYATENPEVEQIEVQMKTMDDVVGEDKVDLVKIDVEGGELAVMKGGKEVLKKNKPIVVFECGIGASDYYGTTGNDVFKFLNDEVGLKLNTLKGFLKKGKPLTEAEFAGCFNSNREYYFVAYP